MMFPLSYRKRLIYKLQELFLNMNRKKMILIVSIISLTSFLFLGIFTALHVKTQIKDLFRMNKELQEDGYYMGDFEFKMMGFAYYLDKGQYFRALSGINSLHKQFKSKEGLIKIPKFKNKKEEINFYLNLQNPETGAFMDDSYPYCTYNEVTENVILHLNALAKETGESLELKYPLKYLDEINAPEKLTLFLDDVSHVGWIASKLPQTTFVFARSLLSYYNGEGVIEENNLYNFSSEWKESILQWFYENQDPETGFWGPRSKTNDRLLRKDLTNTASVIKTFVDKNGNDIYEGFPLRYKDRMFTTTLEILSESVPADDELDEWHEWSLEMGKGTSMLVRYLWNDVSLKDKTKAKEVINNFAKLIFKRFYIPNEGAFSYYPDSEHATVDGTGSKINNLNDVGFFSSDKQMCLWGNPEENTTDLGVYEISVLTRGDFDLIKNYEEVNSIRLYRSNPEKNYFENVEIIFYPKETSVLDAMDLVPRVKHWLATTTQTMGNWVSKEAAMQVMESLRITEVPVYDDIPLGTTNEILQENSGITAIGFDVLQVPRYKITFKLKN